MQKILCLSFLVILTCLNVMGQTGNVRGKLIDFETGEPLIGATIKLQNDGVGVVTDIDGAYSIELPVGTYTLEHAYVGYATKNISEVKVIAGEVVNLGTITLNAGTELEAVVVTASVQRSSEAGLLNFQRNSSGMLDAVSSQVISRTPDGDAAAIVKRVPGVTVEGGKYVFVRGLGDRYSKASLNSFEIPGLDPERNTVQMDIFPSKIIDNIIVHKTFSPDLPGDFTGGMVDVVTKDFPEEQIISASVSLGYNSEATFNDDYLSHNNELSDVFGFGSLNRQLPFPRSTQVSSTSALLLYAYTNLLNKDVVGENTDNFFNQDVSFTFGNQFEVGKESRLGFIGTLNFKNKYDFNPDEIRNNINIVSDGNASLGYRYSDLQNRTGSISTNDGLISGMLGVALKNNSNKYSLKVLHTRTGEKTVSSRSINDIENSQQQIENVLDYFQRTLTNVVISGEHVLRNGFKFNWGNSFTYSTVDNPDRTASTFDVIDGDTIYSSGGSNSLTKEWRDLQEMNNHAKVDLEIKANIFRGLKSKIKLGVSHIYKDREYEAYSLVVGKYGSFAGNLSNGLLPNMLNIENLGYGVQPGYRITSIQVDAVNSYKATLNNLAGYVLGDLKFSEKLKFVGGVRIEDVTMNYQGNNRLTNNPIDLDVLSSTKILPSVNFIYKLKDNMNLRTSYNMTVARPSFREKSQAIIYDPISATFFNGNDSLRETTIHNFDFRWEYFFGEKEMVSLSVFYKYFKDPIEIQSTSASDVKPFNRENAKIYRLELEARKHLGFFGERWKNLALNVNFALIKSETDLDNKERGKYESIANISAPSNRDMVGQSPFTINASLWYTNPDNGWETSLAYNVKGKTLAIVGIFARPDVYEKEFHNLDFKISKRFGDKVRSKLSLSVKNVLNEDVKFFYEFPGLADAVYHSYKKGMVVSLGYTANF